jgi:hypothetical protein
MYRGYADLCPLDHTKGGIPTSNQVKNRQALIVIDRNKDIPEDIMGEVARLMYDLLDGKIDTITIDARRN